MALSTLPSLVWYEKELEQSLLFLDRHIMI